MIRRLLAAVRFDEWWYSKVAAATAVAMSLAIATDTDFATAVKTLLFGLVPIAALAGFGYGINDVADVTSDRRSGKQVRPSQENPRRALLLLLLLVPLGVGSAIPLGVEAVGVEAFGFGLSAAYSLRPLRFKERGLAGPFAAGCAQWMVPTVLYVAAFRDQGSAAWPWRLLITGLLLWSVFVGVRRMLFNQIGDIANDRQAGVLTWTALRGENHVRRVINGVVCPAEAIGFALVVAGLIGSSGWVALGFVPAVPYWFLRASHRPGPRYPTRPLDGVYKIWWPLAVAGALATRDPRFIAVGLGYLLLFFTRPWRLTRRRVASMRA
jgi:4-hydroxybenzoate polyprenyltransferase